MTGVSSQADNKVADFIARGAPNAIPRLYGDALLAAARVDPRIMCLCADLPGSTETDLFEQQLPARFINAGIAEANMIGMAAGMARCGDIPFVHSFCVFVTRRCYDQIANQVAYPALPVKIVGFLPGLTTLLGVSHQAIDDIALMRALPNMTVIEPAGPEQLGAAVTAALSVNGPVYLRMKRPEGPVTEIVPRDLTVGRAERLREGRNGTIVTCGVTIAAALEAADHLARRGIEVTVLNMATLKPLDRASILDSAAETGVVVSVENHSLIGGLGSAVAETLAEAALSAGFARVGIQDRFAEGGSTAYLQRKYGLASDDVVRAFDQAAEKRNARISQSGNA
jgi:transketolase